MGSAAGEKSINRTEAIRLLKTKEGTRGPKPNTNPILGETEKAESRKQKADGRLGHAGALKADG